MLLEQFSLDLKLNVRSIINPKQHSSIDFFCIFQNQRYHSPSLFTQVARSASIFRPLEMTVHHWYVGCDEPTLGWAGDLYTQCWRYRSGPPPRAATATMSYRPTPPPLLYPDSERVGAVIFGMSPS
jgi:hypothetical protein